MAKTTMNEERTQAQNQEAVRRFITTTQAEGVKLATAINYTIGLLRLQDHIRQQPILAGTPCNARGRDGTRPLLGGHVPRPTELFRYVPT